MQVLVLLLALLPGMLPAKATIGKPSKSLALCMTSGTIRSALRLTPTCASGCQHYSVSRAHKYQILAPEAID
ncbi:hypothetical protein V8C34DRAFT_266494 [Trichoderma compactum]